MNIAGHSVRERGVAFQERDVIQVTATHCWHGQSPVPKPRVAVATEPHLLHSPAPVVLARPHARRGSQDIPLGPGVMSLCGYPYAMSLSDKAGPVAWEPLLVMVG